MNSFFARFVYSLVAAGSAAFGLAWIKFELIDEPYPHDAWVAVVSIGSALILAWAAVRGVRTEAGIAARALVVLAGVLAVGLLIAFGYTVNQLR